MSIGGHQPPIGNGGLEEEEEKTSKYTTFMMIDVKKHVFSEDLLI